MLLLMLFLIFRAISFHLYFCAEEIIFPSFQHGNLVAHNSVNNWLTSVLCFCESCHMILIGMVNQVLLRNAAAIAHIYLCGFL